MIDLIIALVALAVGAAAALLTRRRPEFFWPLFIGLSIVGAGLMINGWAIVDEYWAAAIVAGGFLAARQGLVPRRVQEKISLHWWVFLLTVLYLVLESVRGTILLNDFIVLRWVGFYLLFGALLWMTWRWQFPRPSTSSVAKVVGVASSVYFGSYLITGLLRECALGLSRWDLQGRFLAGASYAIFPLLLSFPAALFLLRSGDRSSRMLGWITLLTSILAVGYYESRIGWLALFGMLFFVPVLLGLRRARVVLPVLLIIAALIILWSIGVYATPYCYTFFTGEEALSYTTRRPLNVEEYKLVVNYFAQGIAAAVAFPVSPGPADLDRTLHLKAGFAAARATPSRLIFGGGTYSHRLLMRPYLDELYREKLPGLKISPVVRTTGLVALLVDFGIIGLGLLALNLILAMKGLVAGRNSREWREVSILLFALLLVPLWLTASNIQDMIIYFWLFMPGNLFTLLSPAYEKNTI